MSELKRTSGNSCPTMIDTYVGKRIRLRRNVLGMSQDSLAKRLGLTFQQIQKYEKGTNRVSAGRLYVLAHLLGVPVEYFFKGPDGEDLRELIDISELPATAAEAVSAADDPLSGREAMTVLRSYCRIKDPRVRRRAADLILALAGTRDEEMRLTPMQSGLPEDRI